MKIVGDEALNKLLNLIKTKFEALSAIGTKDKAGLTKLYNGVGPNSDGTMTQEAISAALNGKAGAAHTHDAATSSKAGFLSKDDKTKLDGIATGATKVALANMAGSGNKVGDISINGTTTTMYSPVQSSVSGNAGTATKWKTARNINGMSVQGDADRVNYGVCSTAADTAAKTVDCAGFTLITGAEITVKFTNTNSAAQPTLNVNNQGAKAIYYRGDIIPPSYLAEKRVYTFRYDGKNYELVGDINTDTNTDTKVTNELKTTTKAYVTGTTSSTATHTGTQIFDTGVYLDTTAGRLTATSFKGALVGNADTATQATKDGAGNVITSTYVKNGDVTYYTESDIEAAWNAAFGITS